MEGGIVSKKKVSIINLAINYANTFFLILNGLILVPVYFKFFSLTIYGSYLASANIAAVLGLLEFGLSLVLTQKLSLLYKKKDYLAFSNLMWSGLATSFMLFCILVIIALSICTFVPIWVKALPEDYKSIKYAFLLNCVGLGLNIYSNTLTSIFQAWSKVQISGLINVISALFGITATVFGLFFGLGVISIALGIFLKGLFCTLGLIPFLITSYRKGKYPKSIVTLKSVFGVLKDSLPLFGNTVSKSFIENVQLLIITNFISPTATAVYALTSKIYLVCSNLLAPIGSSIFSSLSQLVGENDNTRLKVNIIKVFSLFTLFSVFIIAVSFALNSSFVVLWVGADKYGGSLLSLILCINIFVSTRFDYINFNLFALGIFGKTLLYDQLAAVSRLILIFFLIKSVGIVAIPASELISTLVFCGVFLNKLFIGHMDFDTKETMKIVFFGFVELGLLIGLGYIYQYFFPVVSSWNLMILHGICVSGAVCTVLLIMNRSVLYFVWDFLKKKIGSV